MIITHRKHPSRSGRNHPSPSSESSDECAIRPKTGSLHHRKWPEQSMLHVTKVTLELRFLRGYRCEEGAQGVLQRVKEEGDRESYIQPPNALTIPGTHR